MSRADLIEEERFLAEAIACNQKLREAQKEAEEGRRAQAETQAKTQQVSGPRHLSASHPHVGTGAVEAVHVSDVLAWHVGCAAGGAAQEGQGPRHSGRPLLRP